MNNAQGKVSLQRQNNTNVHGEKSTPLALIRTMRPEEAADVCRCVHNCYGFSYPNRDMYDSERIKVLNRDGNMVSYVAIDHNNRVIGHAALELNTYNPMVTEFGNAFVLPEYRGSGLLNMFAEALVEAATEKQLAGAFVGSVCAHPYSQKAAHKMRFSDTALFLSRLPNMEFQRLRSASNQRENLLYSFRFFYLNTDINLYVPQHHAQIIKRIYRSLGLRFTLKTSSTKLPAAKNIFRLTVDPYGAAHVFFTDCNAEIVATAVKKLSDINGQVETAYLYLNLADSGSPIMCIQFEQLGYFFAGMLPGTRGHNWLVLQQPNNRDINYRKLEIASELGRDLVDYITFYARR